MGKRWGLAVTKKHEIYTMLKHMKLPKKWAKNFFVCVCHFFSVLNRTAKPTTTKPTFTKKPNTDVDTNWELL